MCGIAGILDFGEPVDLTLLARMAYALRHRGPDGAGYYRDAGIGLACQRLAIVDVKNGRQPIADETGGIQVVFNGEIYNHGELRHLLSRCGHTFRSYSDGEVLPHLYEEYSDNFVEMLDGDFAIALWDSRKRRLLLARDRVGVKPLYYHRHRNGLIFGSEIKSIFAAGLCGIGVDPQGLRDVFYYGQPCAPGTFWRGVHEVLPGHVLTLDGSGQASRRYFTPLAAPQTADPLKGRDAAESFRAEFVRAVRKRLPHEVKYGATLSGGIDSAAVVAVMTKLLGGSPVTGSIRLPGERLDEGTYSRRVARELAVPNIEVEFTGAEACELLPDTLWHLEAPQWFGVAVPFLKLTREARNWGIKVAFTGDGADELLGGYSWYVLQHLERRLARLARIGLASARRPLLHQAVHWSGAPSGAAAHILRVPELLAANDQPFGGGTPGWFYLWSAMHAQTTALLRPSAGSLTPSPLPAPQAHTPLHESMQYEYYTRLPGWVLVLSDRLSMANGIEVRVPFMDRALLDLVPRLDETSLIRRLREKHVLKKAVQELIPAPIRRRRKKPFFTPVAPWFLSGPGRDLAGTYLSASYARKAGFFDPAEVRRMHQAAVLGGGSGGTGNRHGGGTWPGTVAEWASMAVLSTHMLVEQFQYSTFSQISANVTPEAVFGSGGAHDGRSPTIAN